MEKVNPVIAEYLQIKQINLFKMNFKLLHVFLASDIIIFDVTDIF